MSGKHPKTQEPGDADLRGDAGMQDAMARASQRKAAEAREGGLRQDVAEWRMPPSRGSGSRRSER